MQISKFLKTTLAWILLAIAMVIFLGLYIQVSGDPIPGNALVYLDNEQRTYLAPSCVSSSENLEHSTIAEARNLSYKLDPKCRDTGAFDPGWYSLLHYALIKFGILSPQPSRWSFDGNWNRN